MNNFMFGLAVLIGIFVGLIADWLMVKFSKKENKKLKEEIEKKDDCCSPEEKPKKKKELKIEDIEKTDEVVEEVNTESEKGGIE